MLGSAVRMSLIEYNLKSLQKDLISGLIVSLVALPLAMALSIAVGLPPQHGLYTAIVAGIIVPLVGGSVHQVSGPTAAFVVIIEPIIAKYGLRGLIIATVIAGLILVIAGMFKIGRYVRYIPYPVIIGFTAGIAVVIAVLALNNFFGMHIHKMPENFFHKIIIITQSIPNIHWPELVIGIISLSLMFFAQNINKYIPAPIMGIGVGTIVSLFFVYLGFEVDTIGTHFQYVLPNGQIGNGIPPLMPSLSLFGFSSNDLFNLPSLSEVQILIIPAMVIAALAALESVLSATVADGMAGTKHNPNAELIGIGFGNILTGLASGVPATGAIARTATNIHSGGKTPLASSFHGLLIIGYVLFCSNLISYLPMSTLAALLLLTAYRMSHLQQCIRVLKIGPIEDSITLILCFIFTVSIDMVAGIIVGIITACFLLIKRLSRTTQMKVSYTETPSDTIIYQINGSIFFSNVEEILEQIKFIDPKINRFIIDLSEVPFIDMTGMVSLKKIVTTLSANKKQVVVCIRKTLTEQIKKKFNFIHPIVQFENTLEKG